MAAAKEAARFKTTKTDRIAQESAKKLTAARRGASVVKKARLAQMAIGPGDTFQVRSSTVL